LTLQDDDEIRLFAADETLSRDDGFHSGQEVAFCASFPNVAPQTESFLYDLSRRFLSYEDYFGFRIKFAKLSSGLDPIHFRESDVQQNQVRFQFFGFV